MIWHLGIRAKRYSQKILTAYLYRCPQTFTFVIDKFDFLFLSTENGVPTLFVTYCEIVSSNIAIFKIESYKDWKIELIDINTVSDNGAVERNFEIHINCIETQMSLRMEFKKMR